MRKKQKGIMTWIIVWAGLLIVVLYSPIGSPELYTSQNFYVQNQNVAIKKGEILNSPKNNSTSGTASDELDIPDVNLSSKSSYSSGNYTSANATSQGSSGGGMQTQSYQNYNSATGTMNGNGTPLLANRSSRIGEGSSGISMTNGITTISTTSDINNTTNKQSVSNQTNGTSGGTDPGGDPTGDPIPVGDGWVILVFFGVCYVAVKMKYIVKNITPLSIKKK